MKFKQALVIAGVVGSAVGTNLAHAESDINTGAAAGLAASARLDFRVTVPRVIFLQVGTGTAFADVTTVDTVDFTLAVADVGTGTAVAGAAGVTARVLGNGGNVLLTASGVAGGPTNGTQAIAWSQFTPSSSSGALPHPAIGNGAAGPATTLTATANVVNQTATWSFSYNNTTPVAAGTYTGRVTYTAALP
ncbi:MAG: hypothetical protein RLZZ126_223 [Pseudomonadota bacterium]